MSPSFSYTLHCYCQDTKFTALEKDDLHHNKEFHVFICEKVAGWREASQEELDKAMRCQEAGFPVGRGRVRLQIFWKEEVKNRGLLLHFLLGLWEEPTSLGVLCHHERITAEDNGIYSSRQKDGFGAILVSAWCGRDSDISNSPNVGTESSQLRASTRYWASIGGQMT